LIRLLCHLFDTLSAALLPADVLATGSCLPTSALSTLEQQPNPAPAAAAPGSGKKQGSKQSSGTPQQRQQEGAASGSCTSSNSSNVLVVLPCLQQLLPCMATEPRQQLLGAVDQLLAAPHLTAAAHKQQQQGGQATAAAGGVVTGAVRTACQQLQLQLLLRYLYDAVLDPTQDAAVCGWLAAAPKLLWEQGTARPHMSRLLLLMVYHAGRLAQPGSAVQQRLLQVQPQLAALLATALPGSSSSSKQSKKRKQQDGDQQQQQGVSLQETAVAVLIGPLAGLPASVQSLAFDALCFQPQLQPQLLKAVALACRLTSYSDAAVARLLDSVLAAAGSSMPPDQFLSSVATLLSGPPAGGYVDRSSGKKIGGKFDRHQQLVNAVCRWLHTYGPLGELLQLLAPVAVQQWQQQQGVVAGSSDSLRCSSYSCASLAALAAGCWCPAGSTSIIISSRTSASLSAAAAAAVVMPRVLLDQLPAVLAAYCTSSVTAAAVSSTSSSDEMAAVGPSNQPQAMALAAVATAAAAGAEGTSEESAAVDACMPVVLPLLAAVPYCVLPFLEQLVLGYISTAAAAAASDTGLAVAVHVAKAVLGQQCLRAHLVQQEQQLQQLVGKLAAAAQQLRQEGGAGAAGVAAEVQQLQTAVALLCGH
jgi:hypothetical protein